MKTNVIEVVQFRLAPNVAEPEFLGAAETASQFLKSCDGFVRRHLSKAEDGVWLDHVEWRDLSAAKAASEAFSKQASLMPFMQAIDMASAAMSHNELKIVTD